MPYFATSQEWLQQSTLLLQARPTTTRVTSKYAVFRPDSSKVQKRQRPQKATDTPPAAESASEPQTPVASFTLKTYDPESGACLKYRTAKAAEVGRLVTSLGKLARRMAALPEAADDTMVDTAEQEAGTSTPVTELPIRDQKPTLTENKPPVSGGGGGAKKKKKGKK